MLLAYKHNYFNILVYDKTFFFFFPLFFRLSFLLHLEKEWLVHWKVFFSSQWSSHYLSHIWGAWSSRTSLCLSCIVGFAIEAFVCYNVEINFIFGSTVIAEDPYLIECKNSITDNRWIDTWRSISKLFTSCLDTYHLVSVYLRHWSWGNLQ